MNSFVQRRRALLRSAASLAAGLAASGSARSAVPAATTAPVRDWQQLAASYDVASEFVNLENAYFGIMARPVAEDFKRNIDYLNRYNSHFLRRDFDRDGIEAIRAQLAAHAGVATGELAITRGATESLQNLICNYRLVKPGETVMYGNLDYDTMIDAMNDLARRSGAGAVAVQIPEPASRQNVIDAYEQALRRHPRTRLLLLTHVSHRTGLVLPVADIVRMAKARGVDVIVDVAQSWGQLDYRIPDLGADFVGANLHKWIGAPLGLGFLYIREARLADIGVQAGATNFPATDIRSRVHAGTVNMAAIMTIPAALKFHGQVPLAERAARLRGLRDDWVRQVIDVPGVQILTPEEPGMSGAVTSFRLRGRTGFEDNVALSRRLADEFGIFTVARSGPAGGSCIRVTPSYFTRGADLAKLAAAIRQLAPA
ncbi:aminotransferase class V-fold PLP-dependent enzyme [Pseudoduganella albidiflava]|uniref:Aminotransferase class V-fold PLP-dependent enzyme n=1 Tax=Pseudoduganella albidiflava TaxID=321983 RepID=A0A411WW03_9BURK|nr:aminotransferase class V-fold PLP-dependent enzyme [Pseudoduganella albidiflava]QBI00808.1 aminotransferase class V-fold PLP-dependent enzyme [Pseudoduganella albidiflava]GGY30614.1 isopenicillin-N epimerase [Pseudoduganella albidiflava]